MVEPEPCGHFTTGVGYCGAEPTRRYGPGYRCPEHTPAALAGRPEDNPPADSTLAALLARRGRTSISTPQSASSLIDDRAVKSGKSRRGAHAYREAVMREEERRTRGGRP